jgi:hypothetical protein
LSGGCTFGFPSGQPKFFGESLGFFFGLAMGVDQELRLPPSGLSRVACGLTRFDEQLLLTFGLLPRGVSCSFNGCCLVSDRVELSLLPLCRVLGFPLDPLQLLFVLNLGNFGLSDSRGQPSVPVFECCDRFVESRCLLVGITLGRDTFSGEFRGEQAGLLFRLASELGRLGGLLLSRFPGQGAAFLDVGQQLLLPFRFALRLVPLQFKSLGELVGLTMGLLQLAGMLLLSAPRLVIDPGYLILMFLACLTQFVAALGQRGLLFVLESSRFAESDGLLLGGPLRFLAGRVEFFPEPFRFDLCLAVEFCQGCGLLARHTLGFLLLLSGIGEQAGLLVRLVAGCIAGSLQQEGPSLGVAPQLLELVGVFLGQNFGQLSRAIEFLFVVVPGASSCRPRLSKQSVAFASD